MNWLRRLLGLSAGDEEERVLLQAVRTEHTKFIKQRGRAERVLRDFHAADDVIKGRVGETRGT